MFVDEPSAEDTDEGEPERLRVLASYGVLDTPPEALFDELARLATRLCDTPMAVVTLLDDRRQWFKAAIGLSVRETPRSIAFCAHTIQGPGLFQVNDACGDPRFADNPLVTGEPGLRFYAGVPLRVAGGHRLGALAVLDRRPRCLTPEQQLDLESLARQVVVVLEERRLRIAAESASVDAKRQSESLLMIAGRVARLGAWELDIARNRVVWSDVVADIHGMPRGFSPDLDSALAFYEEPDRSVLWQAVAACRKDGTPFDEELLLNPAGGGPARWVRSIGEAVRDANGHITHLRGACQDITERRSHALQIEHWAERLSATFESIPDPFLAVGSDQRVQLVNAAFERLVGRPRAELLRRSLSEVLSTKVFQPPFLDRCAEAMSTPQPVEFQATEVSAGHHFEIRLFPVDGGLTIHARDITQHEQTLAQLRLLETCVRYLNDAVIITDANPQPPGPMVLFANQAVERLCGWLPSELVGQSPRRLQGPLTQRDRLDALRLAVTEGLPIETELINYRRTGEAYWVELKLSPIRDDAGRCTHFVAVERDITERKLAEAHRETLEQQLHQAQKMESIGTLAGGIAHDFNNILGAILGNVELARDAMPPDSGGQAALATISSSAQRARSLVQQILTFGRQQPPQRMRQPLYPLIQEAARLLRATLPAKVSLHTVGAEEGEVFAEVDGNQVQQVLINLCTNAWHAMPLSGGRIDIGLDVQSPAFASGRRGMAPSAQRYAHLWVKDDGSGMSAEVQARIFEPFFTTKPVGQGTGLGLSAVHGIVESHGGRIEVESRLGGGSTFHIYLPMSAPAEQDANQPGAAAADPDRLVGLKVLCVDDDPVMLVTMQALLEREGCEVDGQFDPVAAIERLRRDDQPAVDVLVTDFNMPLMDGMAVVQQAKQIHPDLPVVMASGFLSDKLCEQALLLGVTVLVQKERTVEDLVPAVREAITRTRQALP